MKGLRRKPMALSLLGLGMPAVAGGTVIFGAEEALAPAPASAYTCAHDGWSKTTQGFNNILGFHTNAEVKETMGFFTNNSSPSSCTGGSVFGAYDIGNGSETYCFVDFFPEQTALTNCTGSGDASSKYIDGYYNAQGDQYTLEAAVFGHKDGSASFECTFFGTIPSGDVIHCAQGQDY